MPFFDTVDTEEVYNIDIGNMIKQIEGAEMTNINIGTASSGSLNLSVLDGNLTRSTLQAALKLIARQSLKLEEYEEAIKQYQKTDMAAMKSRLHAAESMIKNLAHNIQGYVDPEDDIGSRSPSASPLRLESRDSNISVSSISSLSDMESRKGSNFTRKESTSVPSNFMEQTKRTALPLSPKIRRHTRTLKSTNTPLETTGAASDAATGVVASLPDVSDTSAAKEMGTVESSKEEIGENPKSPASQSVELESTATLEPSPPPACRENSEGRDHDSDMIGPVVNTSERRGTTASRRASANIARRRFIKASKAISFSNRLANLSRTSMLRARAPKEFSVLERVQRLEEKLDGIKQETEIAKTETEGRLELLEESHTDGVVAETVNALARRLQKVETSALTLPQSTEPAEHTVQVLRKMQTALSHHVERTESLAEESFMNRLISLQQRIIETSSSYQSMASEVSKIKIPESDDTMRAFKVLQYHAKVQGMRHRLTHLDAESLVETLLFARMKQERDAMMKHGLTISDNIVEAYSLIQDKVDTCVELNRSLWDKLASVDKAAGNAWGIVARMMTGHEGGAITSEERRLSFLRGDSESPTPLLAASPTNAASAAQFPPSSIDMNVIHQILDDRLEDFATEQNKSSILSNALKAMEEKLTSTMEKIEELGDQGKELQRQLEEKADDATVQMALRASRMAQASVEGKADADALEGVETFLHKCRKEVVKLRSTQEAGIAGTRRILERKLKRVIKDTQALAENQAANQGAFIGTGQVTLSPRSGQIERGVRWKSDTSKFLPSSPAVSGGESIVVTKGNFLSGLPGGVKGRMMAREDPPRSNNVEPASEALGKMVVSSGLGGGESDAGEGKPSIPKLSSPLKPSPIKKQHQGGSFWGDMDVKTPKPKPNPVNEAPM
mmetsp:Transcript_10644/g.21889  ORF Transcript_10644/g.21889 Transcript_10644/m.21889 type:complete len:906 (+) Transcript_10644:182-2899(+)